MELNNLFFLFLILIFGYFFNQFFLNTLAKSKSALFIDDQFNKPQAFHEIPIPRIGGLVFFLLLILTFQDLVFQWI